MDNIYGFMNKRKTIDLGQVFTPPHIARFAAKLIGVSKDDKVLDSSAGTGAILLSAAELGCEEVYGIEYSADIFQKLKDNMENTDIKYQLLNADASSKKAYDWIREKEITKVIINPPYEKKYKSADIVLNTLNALPQGTLVAMFHMNGFLDKMTEDEKEQMKQHRVEKVIELPKNLFSPFVSVQTSLYIIRANTPQEEYQFYGYKIEDDGCTRKKGKYRIDRDGKWANELEPKFLDIITNEKEDDVSTRQDPSEGFNYQQKVNLIPTEDDFKAVIGEYLKFKISQVLDGQSDNFDDNDIGKEKDYEKD